MNTPTSTTTTTKTKPAKVPPTSEAAKLDAELDEARAECLAKARELDEARAQQTAATSAAEAADAAAAKPGAYDADAEAECIRLHARARIATKRVQLVGAELAATQARFEEVNRQHFNAIELRARVLEGASVGGIAAIGRERGERVAQIFLDLQAAVYELPEIARQASGARGELRRAAGERNVPLPADVLGMSDSQIVEQLALAIAHTVADVFRVQGKDRGLGGASVLPPSIVEFFRLLEQVSANTTPGGT